MPATAWTPRWTIPSPPQTTSAHDAVGDRTRGPGRAPRRRRRRPGRGRRTRRHAAAAERRPALPRPCPCPTSGSSAGRSRGPRHLRPYRRGRADPEQHDPAASGEPPDRLGQPRQRLHDQLGVEPAAGHRQGQASARAPPAAPGRGATPGGRGCGRRPAPPARGRPRPRPSASHASRSRPPPAQLTGHQVAGPQRPSSASHWTSSPPSQSGRSNGSRSVIVTGSVTGFIRGATSRRRRARRPGRPRRGVGRAPGRSPRRCRTGSPSGPPGTAW